MQTIGFTLAEPVPIMIARTNPCFPPFRAGLRRGSGKGGHGKYGKGGGRGKGNRKGKGGEKEGKGGKGKGGGKGGQPHWMKFLPPKAQEEMRAKQEARDTMTEEEFNRYRDEQVSSLPLD